MLLVVLNDVVNRCKGRGLGCDEEKGLYRSRGVWGLMGENMVVSWDVWMKKKVVSGNVRNGRVEKELSEVKKVLKEVGEFMELREVERMLRMKGMLERNKVSILRVRLGMGRRSGKKVRGKGKYGVVVVELVNGVKLVGLKEWVSEKDLEDEKVRCSVLL